MKNLEKFLLVLIVALIILNIIRIVNCTRPITPEQRIEIYLQEKQTYDEYYDECSYPTDVLVAHQYDNCE